MKKTLSLLLVLAMVFSLSVNVFATTDYTNGTQVSFNGEADNDGDGNPDASEAYTVTVPAVMAPGDTAAVTAEGTWASNRQLVVTADDTVTLTNSINSADQKVLDVTFAGIVKAGDNNVAVSDSADLSIANIENALFGTWSGLIEYNVEMQNV